jgi:hypothetical protein
LSSAFRITRAPECGLFNIEQTTQVAGFYFFLPGMEARMRENNERWKLLCEMAQTEQDPQKLLELTREINDLLLGKQRRLERPDDKPPAQNEK